MSDISKEEELDICDLETIQKELKDEFQLLEQLKADAEKLGKPESIVEAIGEAAWNQFINQIGIIAGEDFIKDNKGLKLDLSTDAHYASPENFDNQKPPKHNEEAVKMFNDWQDNFQRDDLGNITNSLKPNYREEFDKNRPTGTREEHVDHTMSIAEIIKDPNAAAFLTEDEKIAFANSEANLQCIPASVNLSKGDKSTDQFLHEHSQGISLKLEKKMKFNDKKARETYDRLIKKGKQCAEKEGRKSRISEAERLGNRVIQAVLLSLLAAFLKKIIKYLVRWFRSSTKSLKSLMNCFRLAVSDFWKDIKNIFKTVADSTITTVLSSILGSITSFIKKAWYILKTGYGALKDVKNYLKQHINENWEVRILGAAKIITVALSAVSSYALSEIIEKYLISVGLILTIPGLGSVAGIVGIFLSSILSGIIAAIILHCIDKLIANKNKEIIMEEQINTGNKVLYLQNRFIAASSEELYNVSSSLMV